MQYPYTPAVLYRFTGTIKELKSLLLPKYNLLACPYNQPLKVEKIKNLTLKHMDTCPPCIELNNLI